MHRHLSLPVFFVPRVFGGGYTQEAVFRAIFSGKMCPTPVPITAWWHSKVYLSDHNQRKRVISL